MFARGCIPKKPACKSHMLITSKYYVLWASKFIFTFTSLFFLLIGTTAMVALFNLTMGTILLQHPNQCGRLLLLSWEPHGFACVKRKERDNLPGWMSETNPTNESTTATTRTRNQQQQASRFQCNSFISSSSLQLHSRHYTGAKQTSLFGFRPW